MAQTNQPQTQQAPQGQGAVLYTIRMKPGCGRMMLGRTWQTADGITTVRPKNFDEALESTETYLEARELDETGMPLEGPTAEVSEAQLSKLLGANGKPKRVIEGYQMQRYVGEVTTDQAGFTVSTRTNYSPKAEVGNFEDTTFEIVSTRRSN